MDKQEQLTELKKIVQNFEENYDRVTETALNCPKGGDQNWFQILNEFNVKPASVVQKNYYYSSGMPVTKGALPIELRKVYEALRFESIKQFRDKFQNIELKSKAEDYWDDFNDRLRDFIKDDMDSYIGKVKQKVGVSDIFANAFSGMNQFSQGLTESGTGTKQCDNCGAPRLDTDQYDDCYFCGAPLFPTEKVQAKCDICGAPKFLEDQNKKCKFCNN